MKQSNIDLNLVRMFIKVAEMKGYTAAAKELNIPKSRVSRNITRLESEIKLQLIYRSTRHFQLTESGENFYNRCKDQIEELENIVSQIENDSDEIKGTIRITAPEDISITVLAQLCQTFQQRYPQVQFDIVVTNALMNLVKNSIDIAIRINFEKDSSHLVKKIGSVEMATVLSPGLIEKLGGKTPHLEALPLYPALIFKKHDKSHFWNLYNKKGERKSVKMHTAISSTNYLVLKELCISGAGVARLPKFLIRTELISGKLIEVVKDWTDEGAPIQLLFPPQKNISLKVKKFSDYVAGELKKIMN